MLECKTYRNALSVPNGRYQNRDQSRGDKLFAKIVDRDLFLTNDWQYLSQQPLRREIYFFPSYFPLYDPIGDYRNGTAWIDWVSPPGSWIFDVKGPEITVSLVEKDLDLSTYKSLLNDRVERNLDHIYKKYPKVYFHYSGGIDSLAALSLVIRKGYGPRTYLIYYRNLPDFFAAARPDVDWSWINPKKIKAIQDFARDIQDQVLGFDMIDVTQKDYINIANARPHEFLPCATTAAMLFKYPDGAHIGGHCGNDCWLHWRLYLDDLVLAGCQPQEFIDLVNNSQWYADQHVAKIGTFGTTPPIGTEFKHLGMRQRMGMQQNNPPLYIFLKDEETVRDVRRLHWKDVSFEDLLDARITREFMHHNIGDAFDKYIVTDGAEGDNLPPEMYFPVDRLNPDIFAISDVINHCPEGREWHIYLRDEMSKTGSISTNSLVSFKAMQMLHDRAVGRMDGFDTPRAIPLIGGNKCNPY